MAVTLTEKVRFYEEVFGPGRMARNCRNFDVRCPICAPKDPNKKKLAILVEDDRCHCWVCGYKSRTLAPLIRRYGTQGQLAEYRDRFMPVIAPGDSRCVQLWMPDTSTETPVLTLPAGFSLLATSVTRDPDVVAVRRYLSTRNVSEDDMWRYKLGYSDEPVWRRRVIVPSFDKEGRVNHYVGRAIDRTRRPKYEAPVGDRHHVVFNELDIDWSRRLVMCEGTFDMMKCGDNVVPLLGSDLSEETALFNYVIMHSTPVVLALDADMRLTKVPRLARKLAEYGVDVSVVDVVTDPGDMTKEAFQEALAHARPFEWHRAFLDRLDHASQMRM